MKLAIIENGTIVATLTEDGWSVPEATTLERVLDADSPLSAFGPADGDPVTCAANRAADLLSGQVTYIRPQPDYPFDIVF